MRLWRVEIRRGPLGRPLRSAVRLPGLVVREGRPSYVSDEAVAQAAQSVRELEVTDLGEVPEGTLAGPTAYPYERGPVYVDACGFAFNGEWDEGLFYDFGGWGRLVQDGWAYAGSEAHAAALYGAGVVFRLPPGRWPPGGAGKVYAAVAFRVESFTDPSRSAGTLLSCRSADGYKLRVYCQMSGSTPIVGILEETPGGQRTFLTATSYEWRSGWHQLLLGLVRTQSESRWAAWATPLNPPGATRQLAVQRTSVAIGAPVAVEVASTRLNEIRFDDYVACVFDDSQLLLSSAEVAKLIPHPHLTYRLPVAAETSAGVRSVRRELLPGTGPVDVPSSAHTPWTPQGASSFLDAIRALDYDTAYAAASRLSEGTVDFWSSADEARAWASGRTRLFAHGGFCARGDIDLSPRPPDAAAQCGLAWDQVDRDPQAAPKRYLADQYRFYRAEAAVDLDPSFLPMRAALVGNGQTGALDVTEGVQTRCTFVYAVYGWR